MAVLRRLTLLVAPQAWLAPASTAAAAPQAARGPRHPAAAAQSGTHVLPDAQLSRADAAHHVHTALRALQRVSSANALLVAHLLPLMLASQHGFAWPNIAALLAVLPPSTAQPRETDAFGLGSSGVANDLLQGRTCNDAAHGEVDLMPCDEGTRGKGSRRPGQLRGTGPDTDAGWAAVDAAMREALQAAAVMVLLINAAFANAPLLSRLPLKWRHAFRRVRESVSVAGLPLRLFLPPVRLLHVGTCCEGLQGFG